MHEQRCRLERTIGGFRARTAVMSSSSSPKATSRVRKIVALIRMIININWREFLGWKRIWTTSGSRAEASVALQTSEAVRRCRPLGGGERPLQTRPGGGYVDVHADSHQLIRTMVREPPA